MSNDELNEDDFKYGSLGHLTKEDAYYEDIVYAIKGMGTMEGINYLKKFIEYRENDDLARENRLWFQKQDSR